MLTKALELEEAINTRASTVTLGDAELASSGDSGVLNAGDDAVEISDSDVDMQVKDTRAKARGPAGKMSVPAAKVVTSKNYRVFDPLGPDNSKKPPRGMAIATGALEKLTTFFDPGNVRERDESRMNQTIGLTQLTAAQSEIVSLRARIDTLTDRLDEERRRGEEAGRRADKAEHKLELLRLQYRSRHQHRRRHSYSRSRSYSRSHSYSASGSEVEARAGTSSSRAHKKSRSHHRRRRRSYSSQRANSSDASPSSHRPPKQRKHLAGPDGQLTNERHQVMHTSSTGAAGLGTLAGLAQLASESARVEQPSPGYTFTVSPRKTRDGKLSLEFAPTTT